MSLLACDGNHDCGCGPGGHDHDALYAESLRDRRLLAGLEGQLQRAISECDALRAELEEERKPRHCGTCGSLICYPIYCSVHFGAAVTAERDAAVARAEAAEAQVEALREALANLIEGAVAFANDELHGTDAGRVADAAIAAAHAALAGTAGAALAREVAALKIAAELLRVVLPMACGYALAHPVGNNAVMCDEAHLALAAVEKTRHL